MGNNLPAAKPKITRDELISKIMAAFPGFVQPDFYVCGVRGYYKNVMGKKGSNDRRIYDDAIFLISKTDFLPFNGNTDPSTFKLATANLKAGVWPVYKFDMHAGKVLPPYLALCQRFGPVTVVRDGQGEDRGMFGINIHHGGEMGTSSLGCQTIPPSQWENFISAAQVMAKKSFGSGWMGLHYTYVLIEN